MKLTTHLHLEQRLRMSGAVNPHTLFSSCDKFNRFLIIISCFVVFCFVFWLLFVALKSVVKKNVLWKVEKLNV